MQIKRIHFDQIDSTNTWAKQHVAELQEGWLTLITANAQTAGRGRFKRVWHSPAGVNIYATFCFFIPMERSDIGHIPQVLAVAVAQILEELGFEPALKWPNDILLSGKKMGGILCETVIENSQRCVIVGVGLNVNMSQEDLDRIDRPATSLSVEGQQNYSVKSVLDMVTHQFSHALDLFLKRGFAPFFPAYQKRSSLKKGQTIRFDTNQEIINGIFHSINEDGSITLSIENSLKNFYAGEFVN